jgi:hypothetical protein
MYGGPNACIHQAPFTGNIVRPGRQTQNFQLALAGGLGLISPPFFAEQQGNKAINGKSLPQIF